MPVAGRITVEQIAAMQNARRRSKRAGLRVTEVEITFQTGNVLFYAGISPELPWLAPGDFAVAWPGGTYCYMVWSAANQEWALTGDKPPTVDGAGAELVQGSHTAACEWFGGEIV